MRNRAARYHAQLLIESRDRSALHRFIDAWLPDVAQRQRAAGGVGVGCGSDRAVLGVDCRIS